MNIDELIHLPYVDSIHPT